jgi:hypothetical protein
VNIGTGYQPCNHSSVKFNEESWQMNRRSKGFAVTALTVVLCAPSGAYGDMIAQTLLFSQNWTNTGMITTTDNWSGVPGIVGFRGDNLTAAEDVDPQTILSPDSILEVDVKANELNPATFTAGGVAEFQLSNPVVALQGSSNADAPYLLLNLNTTGFFNITVAYNLRDIDGTSDNAVQQFALQGRVGNAGYFTNFPAGYVADASTGPNLATRVTPVFVTLPSAADNQPLVQLRIITSNARGTDEWIGIDDIVIAGSSPTTPVPEPASLLLLGSGLAGLGLWARKRISD